MRHYRITQEQSITGSRAAGYTIHRLKTVAMVVGVHHSPNGKTYVKAWTGKRSNPDWHYSFNTAERAEQWIKSTVEQVTKWEARKSASKAQKAAEAKAVKASDHFTKGDVLYTSWGYDQTNVFFYEVMKVLPKSIVIQSIRQNSSDFGGPSGGYCQPIRGQYLGQPSVARVRYDGTASTGGHFLHKWNGKPKYCSSYA